MPDHGPFQIELGAAAGVGELLVHPLDDLARQGRQIDGRASEGEPAGVEAGDVEQLVDQVGEARDLSVEDLDRGVDALRSDLGALEAGQEPGEEVGLHLERGERGLELVRGDEEELVAALDRLLGLGEQAAVVEGERGAARQLLGQPAGRRGRSGAAARPPARS